MDAVKNVIGLGQKTQEGQEPVSGQQGSGTAGEPFDAGNKEDNPELGGKVPQTTDSNQVTGDVSSQPATGPSAATSGKSEQPSGTTEAETSKAQTSESNTDSGRPAIGSADWFKTAVPLGKRDEDSKTGEEGEAQQAVGNSDSADTRQDSGKTPSTSAAEPQQMPESASGPRASALPGTNSAIKPEQPDYREQSLKPADAPRVTSDRQAHGANPSSIPVAGGQRVGEAAGQERERRRSSLASAPRQSIESRPKSAVGGSAIEEEDHYNASGNASPRTGAAGGGAKPNQSADTSGAAETSNVPSSDSKPAKASSPDSSSSPGGTQKKERSSSGAMHKLKEKLHLGHSKEGSK
ncbi:hypothetical protein D0865_09057 [Hortaea werneckii]|uniref:Uncharacterized protein n=1 Tax=Hortaea werneckii TaxID=91943 RepID=A0A3M7C450_HORWE|nr:hypothetical protein D0865_09057 [Hortaea werneckii]